MFKTTIMKISFLSFGIVVFILLSCNRPELAPDTSNAEPEVEKAIRSSIGWAKNKDIDLLYSVICNDSMYLEVDPGARVVKGFKEFKQAEAFWMDSSFKAVRYGIRDLQIRFSASGDVAWFYCILDDINEWKGEPANWENTRWTGVLEKRNDSWIMMQQHFSFAQ